MKGKRRIGCEEGEQRKERAKRSVRRRVFEGEEETCNDDRIESFMREKERRGKTIDTRVIWEVGKGGGKE